VDETLEALESLKEAIVINVPAQAASEQSGRGIRLGLLGGGINVLVSLALLRLRLGRLGILFFRGRVSAVRILRVGVRVRVVLYKRLVT
jgi:hypothetical protein